MQKPGQNTFEKVYEIVARIPRGRVTTYGQIARMIGNPRLSRAVGYAQVRMDFPAIGSLTGRAALPEFLNTMALMSSGCFWRRKGFPSRRTDGCEWKRICGLGNKCSAG